MCNFHNVEYDYHTATCCTYSNHSRIANNLLFKRYIPNFSTPVILKKLRIIYLKKRLIWRVIKFKSIRLFKVTYKIAAKCSRIQFPFIRPLRSSFSWTTQRCKCLILGFLLFHNLYGILAIILRGTLLSRYIIVLSVSPSQRLW